MLETWKLVETCGTLNWHPEPGVMLADFTDFTPPSGANSPKFSLSHYQTIYMISSSS